MSKTETLAPIASIDTLTADATIDTLATHVASERSEADQAFIKEASEARAQISEMSKDDASKFVASTSERTAMVNRKLFEASFIVRMTMGAALYRLYVIACEAAKKTAKVPQMVDLARVLTAHLKGADTTIEDGVKKKGFDPSTMYGISWATMYENYDLYRFGSDARVLAWHDHALTAGYSVNSTRDFLTWCRQDMGEMTAQKRAAQTVREEKAEGIEVAAAALAANVAAAEKAEEKRVKDLAEKKEKEAARIETVKAFDPSHKLTAGKQGLTCARVAALSIADLDALIEYATIVRAEKITAKAAADLIEAEEKKKQAASNIVTINTSKIVEESKQEAAAS